MTQEFSLDQKKLTILAALVLVLVLLVFVAGYLSGTLVGLPETEEQPVAVAPVVRPQSKPPVVSIKVPRMEEEPEPEVVEEEPEPEMVEEIAESEPEEEAPAAKLYSVQVGAFRTQAQAKEQKQQLVAKGYHPYIYPGENSKGVLWYTLRIGDFDQVDEAITTARQFRDLEGSAAVLTHFDSLRMVRDDSGKRIEITPPEPITSVTGASDKGAAAEESEAPGGGEPATVTEEPEAAADEPETAAKASTPGPGTTGEMSLEPPGDEPAGAAETFALPTGGNPARVAETPEDEHKGGDSPVADAEANQFSVQVGAFLNRENAHKFSEKLKGMGYPAYVFHYTDSKGNAWNAVRTGDFPDPETARRAAIEFEGKENITAIVTRVDAIAMVYVK